MGIIGKDVDKSTIDRKVGTEQQVIETAVPTESKVEPSKEKEVFETEVKAQEPTKEPIKEEQEFNIVEAFNKKFEKQFTNEDEIKALFEKSGNYDELATSKEELDQKLKEYKKIAEGVNPLSYFANEDEYIRQQFLKNNKDKLTKESISMLSSLSPEKVKGLSNAEAVKTDLMVNKSLTSEEADAYLADRYGEDFGSDDLDVGVSAKIKVDALDAKERLSHLYDGIDVPETTDWEATRTQLKDSWTKPVAELVNGIDKISLDEGIDFIVDKDMKQGIEQEIMSELISNGIRPSEDALRNIASEVRDRIVLRNIDKVVKSIKSDVEEQVKAATRASVHNDKPLNTSGKSTGTTVDRDQRILGAFR